MPDFPFTASFQAHDPNYQQRVRNSFARQAAMISLNISIADLQPGYVALQMPQQSAYTQQHGFMHAGILATAMDSACGYAAFSLMPADAAVLSVEFKINLLAPAQGERFQIQAQVIKAGRTISVCEARALANTATGEKLVAAMNCTLMAVHGRDGIVQ